MKLIKATDGIHKYVAVFDDKRVPFGAKGYTDFIESGNEVKKAAYLARHQVTEDWNNPKTPGSLSRWILWGPTKSLSKNIQLFKQRFHITD